MNKFKDLFEKEIISNGKKCVIILGSGFHRQGLMNNICPDLKILKDWNCLLKKLGVDFYPTNNNLLDFEQIILAETDKNPAYKTENKILKRVSQVIQKAQEEIFIINTKDYPVGIFKSKYVSDVINLNYDLVAENLFAKSLGVTMPRVSSLNLRSNNSSKTDSIMKDATRHFKIKVAKADNNISFWHPHGDINKPSTMIMGVRNYAKSIKNVEKLRNHAKSVHRKGASPNENYTWYDKLTQHPVLILGASLSQLEWDLWFAITNRMRNFAKTANKRYSYPIFQMMGKSMDCNNNIDNRGWIDPLFDEKTSYEQQWIKLQRMFSE